MTTDRIEAVEEEVRELRRAMVMIVSLQERQQHLMERFGEMKVVQDDHAKRIVDIEKQQKPLVETRGWIVAAVAAAATFVATGYWNKSVVNEAPPAIAPTQREGKQ